MTQEEIIRTQTRVGTIPDGFWGSKSTAAAQKHLRAMMPSPHPFPQQGTPAFHKFYGPHGVPDGYTPPTTLITLPFPLLLYGDPNHVVTKLRPHEKCAASLLRVFNRLLLAFPSGVDRVKAGIVTYDGLYNPRQIRGGYSWSMHAWACAIDLDAARNGNTTHWPTGSHMPIEAMECFAQEGWLGLGWTASRDGMHFQATQPSF